MLKLIPQNPLLLIQSLSGLQMSQQNTDFDDNFMVSA